MQMKNKFCNILLLSLLISLFMPVIVSARDNSSYYYDSLGKAHEAPAGYILKNSVNLNSRETVGFGKISDISADKSGNIYLFSSETGKITVLNNDLTYKKTVTPLFQDDDNCIGAEGMYIFEYNGQSKIYIADTVHSRIVKLGENATVERIYTKPETALISENTEFNPVKIAVNESGSMYVLCRGIYSGAVLIDDNGEFLGFYGSNKIKLTATVLYEYFWKNLFGSGKRTDVSRYVPVEFSNLTVDDKGFIYTVTSSQSGDTGIKYMNFESKNLFPEKDFGDLQNMTSADEELKSSFADITFLGEEIIAVLDTSRNRVFLYNNSGDLLTVFGGQGNYKNAFVSPCAITSYNDEIYVYDTASSSLSHFAPNSYGKDILLASRMYLRGEYDESKELWESVLQRNNGFQTAYISIGRTLMSKNDYTGAMEYFKLGNSKSDYSQAKSGNRKQVLQKWFIPLFIGMALLIFSVFILLNKKIKSRKNDELIVKSTLTYTVFHPLKAGIGFIKKDTFVSKGLLLIVLPVWFVTDIISTQYSGFIFSTLNEHPLDLRVEFIATVVAGLVFVLSNWLIVTMTEGNGKLTEIATVTGLTLIPYIFGKLLSTLLSNIMLMDEGMIVRAPTVLCLIWSAVILVNGISKIHEFNIWGSIKNIVFTALGMIAIAFLILLEISILKQIQLLIQTIFDELIMIIG